ncbi:MAG: hypothetical protein ACRCZP_01960 [Phycicoccus sp.]
MEPDYVMPEVWHQVHPCPSCGRGVPVDDDSFVLTVHFLDGDPAKRCPGTGHPPWFDEPTAVCPGVPLAPCDRRVSIYRTRDGLLRYQRHYTTDGPDAGPMADRHRCWWGARVLDPQPPDPAGFDRAARLARWAPLPYSRLSWFSRARACPPPWWRGEPS